MFKNREKSFQTFVDATPDRLKLTANDMADKFVPSNEMEKEIDIVGLRNGVYL